MNFEKDNIQAKNVFEIVFWMGLIIVAYYTWPALIIVIVAAIFLSLKISNNNKLVKEHMKLLNNFCENDPSSSAHKMNKTLIAENKVDL